MKTTTLAVIAMVLMAFLVMPVMASNADNGIYTNKYAATPKNVGTQTGILQGQLNIGTIGLTEGLMIIGPNGEKYYPELTKYGYFELNSLTPGMYYIYIADGNGGQAEAAQATVRAGQISHPESMLIGHAVSRLEQDIIIHPVIESATYGKIVKVIDQAYVPATYTYVDVGLNNGDYIFTEEYGYYFIGHHLGRFDRIENLAIEEISHMEGSYIDVTAQVQQAADLGVKFAFNNAMNPGGIVNEAQDTVLVIIADPAVGFIKDVHIVYNGGIIDAVEFETITL